MAARLYLVPIRGTGTKADPFAPKYFTDGSLTSVTAWSGMDYGSERWMLVVSDLSSTDDSFVVAQPDGFGLPTDLTQPLNAAQVTAVHAKLEAINLPAQWLTTSLTWQSMLRIVLGIFSFMQRFSALNGNTSLFPTGISLNTTINQLSASVRQNLSLAAQDLGLSTASITGTTTLRAALKDLGTQLQDQPYHLNGYSI